MACGHPLCALIGDGCSLDAGVSRGCRTGARPWREPAPALVEEVRALLTALDPAAELASQRDAAARLAQLVRREARADGNLLALTRDDELEPPLRARLAALTRRR